MAHHTRRGAGPSRYAFFPRRDLPQKHGASYARRALALGGAVGIRILDPSSPQGGAQLREGDRRDESVRHRFE